MSILKKKIMECHTLVNAVAKIEKIKFMQVNIHNIYGKQSIFNANNVITFVATLGAVFIGLISSVLPWWLVLSLAVMPITLFLAWRYSELAAVLMITLQFGVLSALTLKIPLAGGALLPEDIAIPLLLIILAFKNSHSLGQKLSMFNPYLKPLGLLFVCVAVSASVAIGYGTAPVKDILNEARPYATWLLFPLLCLAVDNETKRKRFKTFVFYLAIIVAAGMIFQSLSGDNIFGKGQALRDVYTLNDNAEGVKRSDTPGNFLMMGALVYLFANYAKGHTRHSLIFAIAGIILVAGISVGFGRGLWLSVMFSVVALFFCSKISTYLRFVVGLIIIFTILAMSVSMFKPDYASAVENRFLSIGEEIESGSSLNRRVTENQYALQRIEGSPFLGVGLGGQYKPRELESRAWEGESRYIHNLYLGIAVKLGLPGLLIVLVLVYIMWRRTFSAMRDSCCDPALSFASFWTVVATTLLTAATQPNLTTPSGIASIVLALFFSEAYRTNRLGVKTDNKIQSSAIGLKNV